MPHERAPVALHVVAAEVLTGEEVLLSAGPAVEAIRRRRARGGLSAVRLESRVLMDAAIVNNTPISHAVELGADQVIVLPAMGNERLARAPRGVVGAGIAAIARSVGRRLEEDLIRYADAAELIVLPSPGGGEILPTDFGHADELIAGGLCADRAKLSRLRPPVPVAQAP